MGSCSSTQAAGGTPSSGPAIASGGEGLSNTASDCSAVRDVQPIRSKSSLRPRRPPSLASTMDTHDTCSTDNGSLHTCDARSPTLQNVKLPIGDGYRLPVPEVLQAWDAGTHLGKGGFGAVRAVRIRGKDAAVKRLPPHLSTADASREAELLCKVRHPCLLYLWGACADGCGALYLVTDLMRGGDLEVALRQATPPRPRLLVRVAADASAGLAELHRLGMLHRDFKPQNVLLEYPLDAGVPPTLPLARLADFGLARFSGHGEGGIEANWTAITSRAMGTPGYMADEVLAGHFAPATDVYAVGVTLLQLLTGQPACSSFGTPAVRRLTQWRADEIAGAAERRRWRSDTPPRPEAVYEIALRALATSYQSRPPALAVSRTLRALGDEAHAATSPPIQPLPAPLLPASPQGDLQFCTCVGLDEVEVE
eukprot:TRINITY_DN14902_c0_g1_i1.p1 TRINITY_DN14902_c0_g1~~TRINITY_DN14902_c0_g1_i1.p1  ORF type:complete len:424 (+),score=93.54 TRINITY_DN14902_c0_g1_i1:92-1363(+)